jgi:hypothetical protein
MIQSWIQWDSPVTDILRTLVRIKKTPYYLQAHIISIASTSSEQNFLPTNLRLSHVPDELPQKDFLMAVKTVDNKIQQPTDLCNEKE